MSRMPETLEAMNAELTAGNNVELKVEKGSVVVVRITRKLRDKSEIE